MKVNKKFLASFMTLTMAISPMTAFADTNHSYDGTNDTITGIGTVTTIDTEIYNVVLPTNDSISFNVDPYGLLELSGSNTEQSLKDVISNAAGTVTSKATAVINKSSVGIDVKIEAFLDASSPTASNAAVTLASTKAEAETGDADLWLTVEQLSGAALSRVVTGEAAQLAGVVSGNAYTLSSAPLDFQGSVPALNQVSPTAIVASGAVATTSGTAIDFSLGDVSDAYMVSRAAVILSEGAITYDSNNVYAFVINGYAKPTASVWKEISDANGRLELTMKFTISKKADEPETPKIEDGGTVEASIADGTFTFTIDNTSDVVKVDNTGYQLTGATINGKTVTISNNTDANSNFLFSRTGTQTLTLTLQNGSTHTVKILMKA